MTEITPSETDAPKGLRAISICTRQSLSLPELQDTRTVLAKQIWDLNRLLRELAIARRLWRTHRDLVEQPEWPHALTEELAELEAQAAKTKKEIAAIDPSADVPF